MHKLSLSYPHIYPQVKLLLFNVIFELSTGIACVVVKTLFAVGTAPPVQNVKKKQSFLL